MRACACTCAQLRSLETQRPSTAALPSDASPPLPPPPSLAPPPLPLPPKRPNAQAEDIPDLLPLSDRVLVRVEDAADVTVGGVVLPESAKERPLT
jgi:hypothetical protein